MTTQHKQRFILLVIVPVILALVVLFLYLKGGQFVETDNAYIKAEKIPVSTEVSGIVETVFVSDNQAVKKGDKLFQLNEQAFKIATAQAQAKLLQARTDIAGLKASYREKQAEINLAKANHQYAVKSENRQSDLAEKKFISAANLDDLSHTTDITEQQIGLLEEELHRLATLGGNIATPVESHPAYMEAAAELEKAQLDLTHSTIVAVSDGIVSKPPKKGQYINAGNTALILVATNNAWIEANFTESDLTYIQPGQKVSIGIDSYPDKEWQGVVDSLSPATGAEFSVIPAQNATGNWVKISQRLMVKIKIMTENNSSALRAGLSTRVTIDTEHHRQLLGFSL